MSDRVPSTRSAGPLLLVALVIAGGAAVLLMDRAAPTTLRGDRLLVAPVQAPDRSGDDSLAERATTLLSGAMEGARGLHPIAVDSVRSEWQVAPSAAPIYRREALETARRMDAGWVLLTELARSPERLSLTGSLYSAATGDIEARASVLGDPDSLPMLVDGLVSRLDAFDAAVRERVPIRSSRGPG